MNDAEAAVTVPVMSTEPVIVCVPLNVLEPVVA